MFIDIVRARHSCRDYSPKELTEEQKSILLEAGDLAPSSRNLHPVRLIRIDDVDVIRSLVDCRAHGSTMALRSAVFAVVVAADPTVSDVWIEDASIASVFMQMEAEDLGLGSCWVQIRLRNNETASAEQYVRDRTGIPDNLAVESIIAFGHKCIE